MLSLEKQVTSLEISKKLYHLKVPQRSFFKWGCVNAEEGVCWDLYVPPEYNRIPHPDLWVHGISAFTVAELGEMLPKGITYMTHSYPNENRVRFTAWPGEKGLFDDMNVNNNDSENEADARAKCLIYLIENKIIDVKNL